MPDKYFHLGKVAYGIKTKDVLSHRKLLSSCLKLSLEKKHKEASLENNHECGSLHVELNGIKLIKCQLGF